MVVVLESTTYPGTTREILLPHLGDKKDLVVGENFFLAFSPERVDPGRKDWTTLNTPKVVGGITQACGQVASIWYAQALQTVVPVSSAEVAEMAKLLENTFRMINIGLVNEMALMCNRLGVDVWEVIDAAASKPFGFMKFTPGPGLGGHCIPIDPLYLSWKAREFDFHTSFIDLAAQVNDDMPYHVVDLVTRGLSRQGRALDGAKILILGVAFKRDIDDARNSPAERLIELLIERGASVSYHDPYVPSFHAGGNVFHRRRETFESAPLTDAALSGVDCVVVVTAHTTIDYRRVAATARLVVDSCNAVPRDVDATIVRLGAPHRGVSP
jgi:UDP-N-acetyl-D-glucosamine dehydrogenase